MSYAEPYFGSRRLRRRVDINSNSSRDRRKYTAPFDPSRFDRERFEPTEDNYTTRAAAAASAAVQTLESKILIAAPEDVGLVPLNAHYERLVEAGILRRQAPVFDPFNLMVNQDAFMDFERVYTSGRDNYNAVAGVLSGLLHRNEAHLRGGAPSSTAADDGSSMGMAEYLNEDLLSGNEMTDDDVDDQSVTNTYADLLMPPLSRANPSMNHPRVVSMLEDISGECLYFSIVFCKILFRLTLLYYKTFSSKTQNFLILQSTCLEALSSVLRITQNFAQYVIQLKFPAWILQTSTITKRSHGLRALRLLIVLVEDAYRRI